MFDEIVTLKTRTGKNEEFTWDGRIFVIDAKKGFKVPRPISAFAIAQNTLKLDAQTGQIVEAKVYIVEDEGTEQALPSEPVTDDYVKSVKLTDGLVGQGPIMVDGQEVKMKSVVFPAYKEDFTKNNQA